MKGGPHPPTSLAADWRGRLVFPSWVHRVPVAPAFERKGLLSPHPPPIADGMRQMLLGWEATNPFLQVSPSLRWASSDNVSLWTEALL